MSKTQQKTNKELGTISAIVLQKKGEMDIFDRQNEKIVAIDTKVQEVESGLLYRMSEVDKQL